MGGNIMTLHHFSVYTILDIVMTYYTLLTLI